MRVATIAAVPSAPSRDGLKGLKQAQVPWVLENASPTGWQLTADVLRNAEVAAMFWETGTPIGLMLMHSGSDRTRSAFMIVMRFANTPIPSLALMLGAGQFIEAIFATGRCDTLYYEVRNEDLHTYNGGLGDVFVVEDETDELTLLATTREAWMASRSRRMVLARTKK